MMVRISLIPVSNMSIPNFSADFINSDVGSSQFLEICSKIFAFSRILTNLFAFIIMFGRIFTICLTSIALFHSVSKALNCDKPNMSIDAKRAAFPLLLSTASDIIRVDNYDIRSHISNLQINIFRK